jgi:hypothetical protein
MNLLEQLSRRAAKAVLVTATLAFATAVLADPPIRAARLGYLQGPVSFAPAGDDIWVEARLNRPITIGDSLWTDDNARTEVQFGTATVRLDEYTSVQLLNLDDRTIQLQLTQGRMHVRAHRMRSGEVFEIATPNVAFTIVQPGDYRVDVDPRDNATTVSVRRGLGEVYGEGTALTLRSNDAVRFFGHDLREREFYSLAPLDAFDRWAMDRDRRAQRAVSARYVSPEVVGYADLDLYGTWRSEASYGHVWFPREVAREWAPYRYGHWSWIDPWGWTWVDDAPWGFAPFHYGRWALFGGRWGWVPGPITVRPVYAPALVAFVGGANFQLSISSGPVGGGIGWFPLAPGEVYRPAYNASRDYVRNVNVSNTIVNTTVINNIYQTNVTQVNYRHARVPSAVTAVPTTVFAQAQSVQRARVPLTQDAVQRSQVIAMAAIAPTQQGMVGGAPATNRRPAQAIVQREVVARSAPAAPIAPAAQRIDLLQRNPGRPLERSAIVTSTSSPTAPNVRVVERQTPQPVPAGTQRGMGGPPAMAPRSASEASRPAPQGAVGAPVPVPAPATPQRERSGMAGAGAPSSPSAPATKAPAPLPPAMSRERTPGGASAAPAAPAPQSLAPQPPRSAASQEPRASKPGATPGPIVRQRDAAQPPQSARAPQPPVTPPAAAQPPQPARAPQPAVTPQAASQPRRAPPAPVQRQAPAAVPATPPEATPAVSNAGSQEVPRRGRGNAEDDKKDKK